MPIDLPAGPAPRPPVPAAIPLQATAAAVATSRPVTPDSDVGEDAGLLPTPRPPATPQQLDDALREILGASPTTEVSLAPGHVAVLVDALDDYGELLGEAVRHAEQAVRPQPLPAHAPPAQRLEAQRQQEAADTVREMQDVVHCHLDGAETPETVPGTAAHALNLDLQDALHAAETENGAPLTPMTRCEVITGTLLRWVNAIRHNDADGDGLRIASNVAHSTLKTGALVLFLTVMRQYVGMFTEVLLRTHAVGPTARSCIGLALMSLGPAMTAYAMLEDHLEGRGTTASQVSRLAMIGTAIGTTVAMYLTDTLSVHASFGVQTTSYCMGRDGAQLFLTVQDNAPLTFGSTVFGGAVWSALQFWTSLANDYLAPDSGAGYARGLNQTFFDCTNATTAALDATSALDPTAQASTLYDALCNTGQALAGIALATAVPTLLRGVFNAIPEVADDMVRQTAALRGSDERLRVRASARWPTEEQVHDTALTTFAGRDAIFNNIVGGITAFDAAFGHLLPDPGFGRNAIMATMGTVLCFGNYIPLLMAHDRRPPPETATGARVDARGETPAPAEAAGTTAPAEETGVRRRVAESMV